MRSKSPTPLPPVSLIVCSRNRPGPLFELVQSVLRGDEAPAEIIIVDDSDVRNDDVAGLTSNPSCRLRYVWNHSIGLSKANNKGVALAQHDVLVFTQDDVLVTPDWFGTIVRALLASGPRTVATGQVVPMPAESPGAFAPSTKTDAEPAIYEGRIGEDVLYIQNMALWRATVGEIGWFDERIGPGTPFPGAEDNDFGLRLLEAGYRVVYVPSASVFHRAWRTQAQYLPLRWNYGLARGGFYAKHLSLRDRYILHRMLRDIRIHLRLSVGRLRRDWRHVCGDAVLALGILVGAARWMLTQRKAGTWSG